MSSDFSRAVTSVVKRRACVPCTNAKSKCTGAIPSTRICERCSRLGKVCVFQEMPERRRNNTNSGARRVDALEAKIDGLLQQISILTAQTAPPAGTGTPGSITCTGIPPSTLSSTTPIVPSQSVDYGNDFVTTAPRATAGAGAGDIINRGLLTLEQARALVTRFKRDFVPHFPFVVLGDAESAEKLRSDSPFLFLCILAATLSSNPTLQTNLGDEICREVSSRLLIRSERSLDLLRGLLVHSTWCHYFARSGHAQIFMFVQLCTTVVHDLNLQRKAASGGHDSSGEEAHGDERRAFLGAFWLSVSVARSIQKPLGMRYCSVIDEWSRLFAENPRHPTDLSIRPMIFLQSFNYRVLDFFHDAAHASPNAANSQPDTNRAVASSFLQELVQLKMDMQQRDYMTSCGKLTANLLYMDMLATESWLLEVALEGEPWLYFHPCSPPTSSIDMALPHRTALLWRRVENNKSFIQRLREIPEAVFPNMAFAIYSWLSAILNSHMRAAARLLQDVRENERNTGQQAGDTNFQRFEAQIVANRVDFSATSTALLQAFEGAWGRKRDAFSHETELGRLRRGVELATHCFEERIQKFIGGADDETTQSEDGPDGPISRSTITNKGGAMEETIPAPEADGWAASEESTSPSLKMFVPDEDFWNSFMNDFSQGYS